MKTKYQVKIKLGDSKWFSVAESDSLKIAIADCQRMSYKSFPKQQTAVVNDKDEKVLWIQNV
jgi:hypothetical protein